MMRQGRKGFNLIESAIVLGVVGLVIGGIWVAAATVMKSYQINQTATALILTVNRTRVFLKGNFDAVCASLGCGYNMNITRLLQQADVTPAEFPSTTLSPVPGWISNSDAITTPMGTNMAVTMGDWSAFGFVTKAYSVIFFGLDRASCIKLITSVSSRFPDNTDLRFVETDTGGAGTSIIPVPVATASTLCSNTDPANYLIFYFDYQ